MPSSDRNRWEVISLLLGYGLVKYHKFYADFFFTNAYCFILQPQEFYFQIISRKMRTLKWLTEIPQRTQFLYIDYWLKFHNAHEK